MNTKKNKKEFIEVKPDIYKCNDCNQTGDFYAFASYYDDYDYDIDCPNCGSCNWELID